MVEADEIKFGVDQISVIKKMSTLKLTNVAVDLNRRLGAFQSSRRTKSVHKSKRSELLEVKIRRSGITDEFSRKTINQDSGDS
jgi:hypothetical protein